MEQHTTVLLKAVIDGFENLENGGILVDCTIGGGGHSEGLLERYDKIFVIGIDRDPEALKISRLRLSRFSQRIRTFQRNFAELDDLLNEIGVDKVNGILADLGLSSFQIDSEKRGFSFKKDAFLDMRMGLNSKSAYDVVNYYDGEKLEEVIRNYSEERFARRIANGIIEKRPIRSTGELVEVIFSSLPSYAKKDWKKIVTRVFQAIRIEVNGELENLGKLIEIARKKLEKGGRVGIISFHSLEDRIVKYGLRDGFIVVTKKPIIPDETEIKMNPRARSAKLRIGERA